MKDDKRNAATIWSVKTLDNIIKKSQSKSIKHDKQAFDELRKLYAELLQDEVDELKLEIQRQNYGDKKNKGVLQVFETVAENYNVTPSDLTTKTRKQEFVEPRQLIHWMLYIGVVGNRLTQTHIGELTGGLHHSTISNSCKEVQFRLEVDKHYRNKVISICKELGVIATWNNNWMKITQQVNDEAA